MAILQYVNNSEFYKQTCENKIECRTRDKCINNWDDKLTILTFITSCITIAVYCVQLVRNLFEEDATILWDYWEKLDYIKKLDNIKILDNINNMGYIK